MSNLNVFQKSGGAPLEEWQLEFGGFADMPETVMSGSENWVTKVKKKPMIRLIPDNGNRGLCQNVEPKQITRLQLAMPSVKMMVNAEQKPLLRPDLVDGPDIMHEEPWQWADNVKLITKLDDIGALSGKV